MTPPYNCRHCQTLGNRISFDSSLLPSRSQATQEVCSAACAYIAKKHMTALKWFDYFAAPWNIESDKDQSEDKESDAGADLIPGPNKIGGITEGYPSEVNKKPSANMDKDTSEKHFSGADEEDADLSVCKDNGQLDGHNEDLKNW